MSLSKINNISIIKSRVNNLKNLSVVIPKKKLIVISGLSGSGKSSLAFDTLYAEGQRRYVESLSSYARQFMGRMDKPEVDFIEGISPAIAIEQKVKSRNPRSTVGTSTEVYEYIKLLFARIGHTYSPISGKQVKRHSLADITNHIDALPADTNVIIYAPLYVSDDRSLKQQLQVLMQQGFNRVLKDSEINRIEDVLEFVDDNAKPNNCFLVIDRVKVDTDDDDFTSRVADSAQIAFYEGKGKCIISYDIDGKSSIVEFSNKFELDGIKFEEPSVNMFTFPACNGFIINRQTRIRDY